LFFLRGRLPSRVGTYGCALLAGLAFMLATPFVARLGVALLRPLARLMGPGGRLAADDLARSPSRTGLTVGALGLGLALTITIAGVITSTEEPIFRWLEQVIDAELFVTSGGAMTGGGEHNLMAESVGDEILAASPLAEEVMPIRFQQIDYGSTRVLLTVLPIHIYRRHEHLPVSSGAPDAWAQMERPGLHVLVSDNFADLHGVRPGQDIELVTPRGRIRWRVLGTIPDYSWNRGTIIMDRAQYKEWFGDTLVDSFDVFLVDGADPEKARQDIHRRLGKDHDLMILTNAELQEHIKRLLDQFYVMFYAEAAMALAVSFLGVANTLAISVLQRRREIGLLRAVGATRWQVAWSVAAQALLIGILGTVLGIFLGMLAELYALRVVLVEDSGYYFAFLFPTLMTLLTAFFGLAAAQVAGALPASQAAWQPISDAIAYE
jgi:putative ABC transport system permease protein